MISDDVRRYVDQLKGGNVSCVGQFDLATGGTTTVVPRRGVSSNSVILTMAVPPNSLNSDVQRIEAALNQFTVTHTNSGSPRTFRYVFFTGPLAT